MDSVLNRLEAILEEDDNFFIKIRFLQGCDEKKLSEFLLVLKDVELFYSANEFVPKRLPFLLMDLESALWSMMDS